ncbi:hypothetical protein ACNFIC_00700 [Pseudomonas sp. NY15463]|uniref:hypothetical protein n=1 Tax=Pseudomonas sp. NY15463 TaxID=3400361 RepID=UPI003A852423
MNAKRCPDGYTLSPRSALTGTQREALEFYLTLSLEPRMALRKVRHAMRMYRIAAKKERNRVRVAKKAERRALETSN